MKILAWDTSSSPGVIVAFESTLEGPKVFAEWSLSFEAAKHSERLLWGIDLVLKSAGWTIQEVNALGVGVGPGSFTGLRIGVTTARALAGQLGIPIVPVSSLVVLSRPLVEALAIFEPKVLSKVTLIAATDAAKGEWFTLMGSPRVILKRADQEQCLSPEDVFKKIVKYRKRPVWVGSAFERNPEFVAALKKKFPSCKNFDLAKFKALGVGRVMPGALVHVVHEGVQKELLTLPHQVTPRYLRGSEAEEKMKKGLLKVAPLDKGR